MTSLLDSLRIGRLYLSNRIVMPPMATELSTERGEVTERLIRHYEERAEGLGLLIVEHSYISLEGKRSPRQLGIYSDDLIPGLRRLTEAVKSRGTPVALQINHAGSLTQRSICGSQPLAPSAIRHPRGVETPRALTHREIDGIIKAFREAARRAADAGFDAVEIHGAHGFLLSQFLSPLTNRRRDVYGGSLESRVRLPLRVVEEVRRELGRGFPLLYRLGVEDMMPGGLTLEEGVEAARLIANAGVDILDISGGLIGSSPPGIEGPGYFVPQAEAVKRRVDIPVIGVGGIKRAEEADAIIRSGRVDLVAIGRALLKDPKWALKTLRLLRG